MIDGRSYRWPQLSKEKKRLPPYCMKKAPDRDIDPGPA